MHPLIRKLTTRYPHTLSQGVQETGDFNCAYGKNQASTYCMTLRTSTHYGIPVRRYPPVMHMIRTTQMPPTDVDITPTKHACSEHRYPLDTARLCIVDMLWGCVQPRP